MSVHPPSHTHSSFFEVEVRTSCPAPCELSQVHVGRSKDGLDLVDSSLNIVEVTNVFGSFVKFSVQSPEPAQDGHYKSFSDVFGTATNKESRPSLQTKKGKQKSLPFTASVQHVRNANLMIQCEECEIVEANIIIASSN